MRLSSKQFTLSLIAYLILRSFSFAFPPSHYLNTTATIVIILVTCYLLFKKNVLGWYIVAGEILLGGTGSFLQAFSLTLRSYLLLISLSTFFVQEWKHANWTKREVISVLLLVTAAGLGLGRGWFAGHSVQTMLGTAVPYLFLLYYFPLQKLFANEQWKRWCLSAVGATIVGQTLFILLTFSGFATGLFQLQSNYYHWFRDIAGGKITWVAFNFYRIVINEQLLLIPILLWLLCNVITNFKQRQDVERCKVRHCEEADSHRLTLQSHCISEPTKEITRHPSSSITLYTLTFCTLFLFSINLTRSYLIALVIGLLLLYNKNNWKRWLTVTLLSLITFICIFCFTYLIASAGKSFGFEVFGLRLQSIVTPQIEDSSLSRLLLLPKILIIIAQHPLIGSGLGTLITVYSPVSKQTITTNQFDWGYLQISAELGGVGFLIWMFFLWEIFKKIKTPNGWPLASFGALLIINITAPALFHVLGIIWLIFLLTYSSDALPQ